MINIARRLAVAFASLMFAAEVQAQTEPIRHGDGWAIHAQHEAADWRRLVTGGNLASGIIVQPQPAPNDHNTGSELKHLTDGALAGADGRMWSDKRAMGWAYMPYTRLTFDLGEPHPIGQIAMRLQVINRDNTLPASIKVSLSDNGDVFSPVRTLAVKAKPEDEKKTDGLEADSAYVPLPFDPPAIYAVVLDVGYRARYVQLDFALSGTMVTDEIAIVPAAETSALKPIPPPPVVTIEYHDYVFDRRDQYRRKIAAGNLIAGRTLHYSPTPTQYLNIDDDDPRQLTDGTFGERIDEAIWFERGCVGWQGPPQVTIFADLGESQPIDSVVLRLLGGKTQNALEFPDEIKVLLSADGREYHLAAARHKRGLDDLSADAWDLPEEGTPWVHNFQLLVKQKARYVAVQIAHKKQFICSDELAIVRGSADLPAFQPSPDTRVTIVTEGVAFEPVWGSVLPVCENLPLKSRLQKLDARASNRPSARCKVAMHSGAVVIVRKSAAHVTFNWRSLAATCTRSAAC